MRKLNTKQRAIVAEKLADFGNIAAGSFIFGAAIAQRLLAAESIIFGLAIVIISYLLAVKITRTI